MIKNEVIVIGCDVATRTPNAPTFGIVGIVAIKYPELKVFASSFYRVSIQHPYQSGFLAKREGKALTNSLKAFLKESACKQLNSEEIIIFIDGAGRLHPRKHGLACHVGEQVGLPTIGITKKYLIGEEKPETTSVISNNGFRCKITGMWLNGKLSGWKVQKINENNNKSLKPIYVSTGWSIPLENALDVTVGTMKHRIPEPIRLADHLARQQLFLIK